MNLFRLSVGMSAQDHPEHFNDLADDDRLAHFADGPDLVVKVAGEQGEEQVTLAGGWPLKAIG